MSLVSRKGLLAVTAVLDVAIHSNGRPVSAKALAARNTLPPRHLEPILQGLVRAGILKGIRGPRGGYELGRERQQITTEDILRATQILEDAEVPALGSPLLDRVVLPAIAEAEQLFSGALSRISIADLQARRQA
jgi:Rrf2 family transcriptional regulator, iron-sulfur cluster assembly transcription factor